MQITCLKCKKVYKVDPNKIPSGITSTKCRSCGNSIRLPKSGPQKPSPRRAQVPPSPKSGFMKITCQYCSQQYNINPKAVPDGVTSTKCKACGHTISLKTTAAAPAGGAFVLALGRLYVVIRCVHSRGGIHADGILERPVWKQSRGAGG